MHILKQIHGSPTCNVCNCIMHPALCYFSCHSHIIIIFFSNYGLKNELWAWRNEWQTYKQSICKKSQAFLINTRLYRAPPPPTPPIPTLMQLFPKPKHLNMQMKPQKRKPLHCIKYLDALHKMITHRVNKGRAYACSPAPHEYLPSR